MRLIVFCGVFLTFLKNTIHFYPFIKSITDLETAPAPLSLTRNKQLFTENESLFKYSYIVITQLSSCFLSLVTHHFILQYMVKASESPPVAKAWKQFVLKRFTKIKCKNKNINK